MQYENAAEYYLRVLSKDSLNIHSILGVAHSYYLLKDVHNAEKWYEKVFLQLDEPEKIEAIHYYNYAQTLSSNQKYDDARKWYDKYAILKPDDRRVPSKRQFIVEMNDYLQDTNLYELRVLDFNSEHADFGVTYYDSGFVFISSRDKDFLFKNKPASVMSEEESMLDLFFIESVEADNLKEPRKFHKKLNTKFHEGPLVFYDNGRKVIFTRNNYSSGKKEKSTEGKLNIMLYSAELDENDNWTNLNPLPFNNPEYSIGHPSLSDDGKALYFSSNMPGGEGGNDIYVSFMENGAWGLPINLGYEINSEGDEMFPFISDDSTLYFTSDGWGGFGGLDIFRSSGHGRYFTNSYNIGAPLNTNRDDFSFVINEKERKGYFSSDRPGGKGSDDVYAYTVKNLKIEGLVLELYDDRPIPDVDIFLINIEGDTITKVLSDKEGRFRLELPFDSEYYIKPVKEGYTHNTYSHFSTLDRKAGIDSLTVYMWKHELFSKGILYNNETQKTMPEVWLTLYNPLTNQIDSVLTDQEGKYIFPVKRGTEYAIIATLPGFVGDTAKINTNRIEEGTIVNDLVLESNYIDKSFVFFDFDKSNIKPEFRAVLDSIVLTLQEYPTTVLNINAHADARGSIEYNQALSERRAESAKKYIVNRGISSSRISTKGFGELLIINRCVDGVNCKEIEHSKNRRAELKIVYPDSDENSMIQDR